MQEIFKILIGILVLLLGMPIGSFLAKQTKEELASGQKWFKLITLISFIGTIISLAIRNDVLFFSFAFMVVVTGQSLKKPQSL